MAIAVAAALQARDSPGLPWFEACCIVPVGMIGVFELRPSVLKLLTERGHSRAMQRFRRQLDALPETPHPLGRRA